MLLATTSVRTLSEEQLELFRCAGMLVRTCSRRAVCHFSLRRKGSVTLRRQNARHCQLDAHRRPEGDRAGLTWYCPLSNGAASSSCPSYKFLHFRVSLMAPWAGNSQQLSVVASSSLKPWRQTLPSLSRWRLSSLDIGCCRASHKPKCFTGINAGLLPSLHETMWSSNRLARPVMQQSQTPTR